MSNSMSGSRATTPEEAAEHDRVVAEEVAALAAARAGAPLVDTSAAKVNVKGLTKADASPINSPGGG